MGLQDPFKDIKICKGNLNEIEIIINQYKIRLIQCLYMKRLSEYIHFVHSQHETQEKCILRGVL